MASPSPAADAAPDWAAVATDIVCPLCTYNLRGLTEPRCPECGYRFLWRNLLDIDRRIHPYIFEHHPRRNVWSFIRTAVGGLRPWKFWSSLRPDQTSRPKRLVVYWGTCMLFILVLLVLACGALFVEEVASWNVTNSLPIVYGGWVFPGLNRRYLDLDAFVRTLKQDGGPLWAYWAACLAWPWLTLATLMIFRASMRQAKVKTEHVLRSVLYSGDAFLWPTLLMTASMWFAVGLMAAGVIDEAFGPWLTVPSLICVILCLLPVVKLWAAYQRYLRFRHAFWTIVASQVILFLAVVAAADNIHHYLF